MAEKKRSVGLVVLTEIPNIGVVALLRRRGKVNPEKEDFRESYPGGCQVTCHGRAEEGESFENALFREMREEVGFHLVDFPVRHQLVVLVDNPGEKEDVITYGAMIPWGDMIYALRSRIRLESSSGGLEFLLQSEVDNIQNLRDFDKRAGVTDLNVIAMFEDEIEAVRLAFEKLVPQAPTS